MTDLATLGLAVDSGPVAKARDELGRFVGAAKAAEGAAKGFEAGVNGAAKKAMQLADFVRQNDAKLNSAMRGVNSSREEDILAYGAALDDLRGRFSPLYAVEKQYQKQLTEINAAHRLGALSQEEVAVAIGHAEAAYRTQARVIQHSNKVLMDNRHNAALSSYAMSNLAFQINDVATMAAMGMSPLKILASQAGQFYQILSMGEGGVRGSLGYLGGIIKGLITPFRLLIGTAAGLGLAAIGAYEGWKGAQREITIALLGTGAAAGIVADDINRISFAAANTGKQTVGDAREMALAFAATGRVGAEMAEQLVGIAPQIAKIFGEDQAEAGQRLAKAFADPGKGVDELNKRLLAFDANTRTTIKSLTDQGRFLEAQKLLLAGVAEATAAAAQQTSGWSGAWNQLTASASIYWAKAGENINVAMGGGSMEQQIENARTNLEKLKGISFFGIGASADSLNDAEKRLSDLTAQLERNKQAAIDASEAQKSLDLADAIKRAAPAIGELRTATDAYEKLKLALSTPDATSRLTPEDRGQSERALAIAKDAVTAAQLRVDYQKTGLEIAREDADFAIRSINARTTGQQAEIAYQQTLSKLRREGDVNAEFKAAAERNRILTEGSRRVLDEVRQRNFAAQQGISASKLELSLIGKTADEAAKLRAEYEAIAAVKAQAFAGNRTAGETELLKAISDAREKAAIESQIRREQFTSDLEFERAQISRSQSEQAVYARLQSAGYLSQGQIKSAEAEAFAAKIRYNDVLSETIALEKEFSSSLVKDLMAGKSATEALSNALGNLASKLMDKSMDGLLSAVLGGGPSSSGGGGILSALLGGGGGDVGLASWAATVMHSGGIAGRDGQSRSVPSHVFAGAPRYHAGGIAGLKPDEVPAILQRGERVIPKEAGQGGDGAVTVNITNHIDASGAYPESIEHIKKALAEDRAGRKAEITAAVRDAKDRRLA